MRDRSLIWAGLAFFLAFLSFPVWHNLSAWVTAKGPAPVLPKNQKQCVAPLEYMKTSHMTLLLAWRDSAIRRGVREYIAPDGRHYKISLTATCLEQCHGVRTDFCDRCHNYVAAAPACWDCHLDAPRGASFQLAMPAFEPASPLSRLESRHGRLEAGSTGDRHGSEAAR